MQIKGGSGCLPEPLRGPSRNSLAKRSVRPHMPAMARIRLDQLLVARGLAETRARARDSVLRGAVTVDGRPATKPGEPVEEGAIVVDDPAAAYVSRAALKLTAGLDGFGFSVAGGEAPRHRRLHGRFHAGAAGARRRAGDGDRRRPRAAPSADRGRSPRDLPRGPERPRPVRSRSSRAARHCRLGRVLHLAPARAAAALDLAAPGARGCLPREAAVRGRPRQKSARAVWSAARTAGPRPTASPMAAGTKRMARRGSHPVPDRGRRREPRISDRAVRD